MPHLEEVAGKYLELQERACDIIMQTDGSGKFTKDTWKKNIGYGITRVMAEGSIIKKGAINFSKVSGRLSEKMAQVLEVDSDQFSATGISSIFHAKNPFIPTIHMNVRYFSTADGMEWFGGGIDLTPIYIDRTEARDFHLKIKAVCDKYDPTFYDRFKPWADDYFFLPHRDETRGVGGIFFDRQQPSAACDFQNWFNFTIELATLYPDLYAQLMKKNGNLPYGEQHKKWQKLRWGRYVEFNLIYDRGTKFGLESGGNTESILVSMPPEANWNYNFVPERYAEEEKTQQLLKKGIDWINFEQKK
ncbi:MAG: oxygen-dependent coproporphyrinogen oxidase [Mariniphaga sp.]